MYRASMLALALVALPASAFDWEKWVDKQVDKVMEEGRQDTIKALSSKDVEERIEAVKHFSGLRDKESIGYVTRALSDPDARVRETAASGLWRIEKDAEPARAQLMAALDDANPNVVARAAGALQALGVKEKDLVVPRQRVLNSREASDSSRFLAARCLHRLQLAVSPLIMGQGRPGIDLGETLRLRPSMRRFQLADDILFECCFDDE